jgi:hypothetical protein
MSFVYYNPETNQIEQRRPVTINKQNPLPYIMNIVPEDFNLAMKNTQAFHAVQPNQKFAPPSFLDNKENEFKLANPNDLKKFDPATATTTTKPDLKKPVFQQVWDITESAPIKDPKSSTTKGFATMPKAQTIKKLGDPKQQFLSVEDFNEKDMGMKPDFIDSDDDDALPVRRPIPEKKFKEDEKPELSLTEKLLGHKYYEEERKKNHKVQMNLMTQQLTSMDEHLNYLEKEHEQQQKATVEADHKVQSIHEELQRRALEREADKLCAQIDKAINDPNETQDTNRSERLNDFYNENEQLYAQINRMMNGEDTNLSYLSNHIGLTTSEVVTSGKFSQKAKSPTSAIPNYPTVEKFKKKPTTDKVLRQTVMTRLTSSSKIQMRNVDKKPASSNYVELKNPTKVAKMLEKTHRFMKDSFQ